MSIKYRKKPVIIEAFQMTKERRMDNSEWPEWLHLAWNKHRDEEGALYPSKYPDSDGEDELIIVVRGSEQLVSFGDWLVKGVEEELYPCDQDIFEKTYEPVEDQMKEAIKKVVEKMISKIDKNIDGSLTSDEYVKYADALSILTGIVDNIKYSEED